MFPFDIKFFAPETKKPGAFLKDNPAEYTIKVHPIGLKFSSTPGHSMMYWK